MEILSLLCAHLCLANQENNNSAVFVQAVSVCWLTYLHFVDIPSEVKRLPFPLFALWSLRLLTETQGIFKWLCTSNSFYLYDILMNTTIVHDDASLTFFPAWVYWTFYIWISPHIFCLGWQELNNIVWSLVSNICFNLGRLHGQGYF